MQFLENAKKMEQKDFEKLLDELCNKYHNNKLEDDVIDDKTYDKLVDLYENKFKIKFNKVGAKSTSNLKSKLPYYMGSLDKVKTEHALELWIKKNKSTEYV